MGGANLKNFAKCLEGDKFELWSVVFNVRGMAHHMGSFIVLKLANVNDWELGLSPLLPSLQMTYKLQPQYSSMDQTSVEQSFDFLNNSLLALIFKMIGRN
jgi:hypothetical protein